MTSQNFSPEEMNQALASVSMQTRLELENALLRNRLDLLESQVQAPPSSDPIESRSKSLGLDGVIE